MKHVIQGRKARDKFIYNDEAMTITDKIGITVKIFEPLEGLSETTKRIYVTRMFQNIYQQIDEFKIICQEYKERGLSDVIDGNGW